MTSLENSPQDQAQQQHSESNSGYWEGLARQLFSFNELHVQQKVLTLSQKYYIKDAQGNPMFYVVRPPRLKINIALGIFRLAIQLLVLYMAFQLVVNQGQIIFGVLLLTISNFVLSIALSLAAPYRHIEIYRDDSEEWRLLTITQDNKLGFYRDYTLLDMYGEKIAVMQRNVFASIFRRDWWVNDPQGEFLTRVREDSLVRALLRRYLGPMYGLLRTNFNFEDNQKRAIGVYDRKLTLRDQYRLRMEDSHHPIDRRICLAMAILLDTGESR